MWVYSITVYGFSSYGISVILILTCGIVVSSSSAVCGFHFVIIWSSFWLTVFSEIRLFTVLRTVLFSSAFFSIQYAKKKTAWYSLIVWQFVMKRAKEVNIIATRISLDVGFRELKNTL